MKLCGIEIVVDPSIDGAVLVGGKQRMMPCPEHGLTGHVQRIHLEQGTPVEWKCAICWSGERIASLALQAAGATPEFVRECGDEQRKRNPPQIVEMEEGLLDFLQRAPMPRTGPLIHVAGEESPYVSMAGLVEHLEQWWKEYTSVAEPSRRGDASCRTFDATLAAIRRYGKEGHR